MDNTAAAGEEAWSERVHVHEQALQHQDPEALRAAEAELLHRAETCGLSPGEAQLLTEVTLAMGRI